jgi:hypothetical protein
MRPDLVSVHGIVIQGYRVASRKSADYPYGTIEKQKPCFKALGLDLDRFFNGTLNVSIAPSTFEMVAPEFTFRQVCWTDLHPPEDFSFSACRLRFNGREYEGYVYYPHPETKKAHFESASLIEILTLPIPDIRYGDGVDIDLRADEVHVKAEPA